MMRKSGGSTEPRFIQVSLKREPDNSKFCYAGHQMVVLTATWVIWSFLCKEIVLRESKARKP